MYLSFIYVYDTFAKKNPLNALLDKINIYALAFNLRIFCKTVHSIYG